MSETKQKSIFILVNTLDSVKARPYGNHMQLAFFTAKHFPEYKIHFWNPERMAIDTARNQAAIYAMEMEADYLLFLDDDVMVPPIGIKALIDADKDIVAGLVCIRGYPFNAMAFRWIEDKDRQLTYFNDWDKYQTELPDGSKDPLVKCAALGFSFCLIKVDILRALEPPFFLTGKDHTEDVYFCLKAQETLSPTPTVWLHTGIRCGHMLNAEPIEWDTRAGFQKFYFSAQQEFVHKRDPEYIAKCIEAAEKHGVLDRLDPRTPLPLEEKEEVKSEA